MSESYIYGFNHDKKYKSIFEKSSVDFLVYLKMSGFYMKMSGILDTRLLRFRNYGHAQKSLLLKIRFSRALIPGFKIFFFLLQNVSH